MRDTEDTHHFHVHGVARLGPVDLHNLATQPANTVALCNDNYGCHVQQCIYNVVLNIIHIPNSTFMVAGLNVVLNIIHIPNSTFMVAGLEPSQH